MGVESMKKIKLTQGRVALVDDADFERVNQFKWYAHTPNNVQWYARRAVSQKPTKIVLMHRLILSAPNDMLIDHRNGDGLDNRRQNLRLVTRSENAQNQRQVKKTAHLKGTYNCSGRWRSQIKLLGQPIHLGYFKTEQEAANAYDEAAIKYFGSFACTNQLMECNR